MKINNERKLGALLSYISIIASTVVGLLYTPFLVSKLGQSEYGLYSLVSSIIGYLTVLDLGFGNAIIVFTTKYNEKKEYDKAEKLHGMFQIIYIILSVIVFIFGIILFVNVDNFFGKTMNNDELIKIKNMMLILTFNMVITFVFAIYSSIINAYEKFVFQKILSILNTILKPLIMIPLLFLGYKSICMCIVITGVNIFILMCNYLYCKKKIGVKIKFKGFEKSLFIEIFRYSFYLFLATIVDKINWSIDNFILGIYCGAIEVSIYAVASQLNTLFLNLSTAISGVLLPKISKMVANNVSNDVLTDEFIKVGRIQYYIIFLMASGLVLLGKNFINIWVGDEYSNSYYIALILIIPLCFPLIQNLGISIMQAKNKYKFKAIATTIMAIVNVFISAFLAKNYGAIGAAWGTAISLIICNIIIINIYYYKVININVIKFWKNILKMTFKFLFVIVLMINFIYFTNNITGIYGFLLYGIVYTILYSGISYLFVMNEYEKGQINQIFNKIRKVK